LAYDQRNAATSWLATSPADYDRRLMVRGHKRDSAEQGDLFYVATPTAAPKAIKREELPGQLDMFGGES
jgi:hypothetical protein